MESTHADDRHGRVFAAWWLCVRYGAYCLSAFTGIIVLHNQPLITWPTIGLQGTGPDGRRALLRLIDDNRPRIITSEQVEMEYEKNRWVLILQASKSFKMPEWGTLDVPAFLEGAMSAKMLAKYKGEIKEQVKRIKDRLDPFPSELDVIRILGKGFARKESGASTKPEPY